MKLALLSDIHGNAIALDAVLADVAAQGGVDRFVLAGDYCAIGPDPDGVMARLLCLPIAACVRGNTDHDLLQLTPEHKEAIAESPLYNLDLMWTRGAISKPEWLAWLAALPIEQHLTLPDGTRMLIVHASPGQCDGVGFHPRRSEAQMRESLANCGADVVVVGHSHVVMDVRIDQTRIINLGNVSLPMVPDPARKELRASYTLLEADANGYRITPRWVDYDHAAVIDLAQQRRHPAADLIAQFMRGEKAPWWMRKIYT